MVPITRRTVSAACFLGLFALASPARAQSNSHLGIGAGVDLFRPTDHDAQRSTGIGFVYRWHSFHSGWGPTVAFAWHDTDFNQSLDAATVPLGSLHMRAIMVGIGHTQHLGRLSVSASVIGGYAFNRLVLDGSARDSYERAGLTLLDARVRRSAAARSEASLWYDVTKRLGVEVSAGYLLARPQVVITTLGGSSSHHLRADAVELAVGIAVGLDKRH